MQLSADKTMSAYRAKGSCPSWQIIAGMETDVHNMIFCKPEWHSSVLCLTNLHSFVYISHVVKVDIHGAFAAYVLAGTPFKRCQTTPTRRTIGIMPAWKRETKENKITQWRENTALNLLWGSNIKFGTSSRAHYSLKSYGCKLDLGHHSNPNCCELNLTTVAIHQKSKLQFISEPTENIESPKS